MKGFKKGKGPVTIYIYMKFAIQNQFSDSNSWEIDRRSYSQLLTEKDIPETMGRLSAFMGNAGVLLRAYIYASMLGAAIIILQVVVACEAVVAEAHCSAASCPYTETHSRPTTHCHHPYIKLQ